MDRLFPRTRQPEKESGNIMKSEIFVKDKMFLGLFKIVNPRDEGKCLHCQEPILPKSINFRGGHIHIMPKYCEACVKVFNAEYAIQKRQKRIDAQNKRVLESEAAERRNARKRKSII